MDHRPSREEVATPNAVETFRNSSNIQALATATSRLQIDSSRVVTRQRNLVFRVTGLPASQTNDALVDFIRKNLLKVEEQSQSKVTASIVPSCSNNKQETVALVEFGGRVPDFLSALDENPLEDWQVEMGDVDINFDQHFFGFTQLYTPKADKPITADIIAITGLDGHAYGSWRGKGNLGRMWLRHFLSKDLPYCRTMTYGYNSKLSARGIDTIMDYSRGLMEALKKIRNTEELRQRPLFFIAHSFGGIILAHCLVKAVQTNEDDHPTIATLHKATYGMLLFGIPHRGLVVNDIEKMLAGRDNHPRSALLQQIRVKSDLLENQLTDFKNLVRDRKVVSFYETRQTRQLQFDGDSQRWERTGDFITKVDNDSALLQLPDFMEDKIPLDSDHSMMVKFGNRNDTGYTSALDKLQQFEQEASKVVKARFSRVQRTSTVKYFVPYTSNPDFVGRLEILKILKDQLGHTQQTSSTSQARTSLYGIGGAGKTQIALEYVFQLQKTHPTVSVFWIHASSAARFRQAFASIAQEYDIPGYAEPKVDMLLLVKGWLEEKDRGEWLMIIDNADDMQLFFGQPVGTLPSPSKEKDEEHLARYLPECAHGTILITTRNKQVGVRMTKGQQPIEVLRMNEGESVQLLRAKLKDISATVTQFSTLSSQLEHLPLALAQAAAFIQETSITVHKYLQLLSNSDMNIVHLLSKDFETVGRDTEAPQAVAQTWMLSFQQIERQHVLASELLSFMSMLDRQDIPAEFLSHYGEQAGVPRGEMELTEALGILKAFSFVTETTDSGSFDMHRLVQLVTQTLRMKLGADHPDTLDSMSNLALTYMYQDRWKEAEDLNVELIKTYKIKLGADHPHTLISMSNLAYTYRNQGRLKEAEDLNGRLKEAEDLNVEVMEACKIKLGADHPHTLISMGNLASTYMDQGRWKEAEDLNVEVMEIRKIKLGADHPDLLTSMNNLATTYMDQGRWKKAEDLHVEVMETRKMKLGADHPQTLISMHNVAFTWKNQGRHNDALALMKSCAQTRHQVLGSMHPDTIRAQSTVEEWEI
ncbi:kinesin [Trichoderma guizhouense]|uniref:Kinesin n=1 Tax=Trichoderma guizhouense TaxID=1491466 RepID=A0A1T3CYC1_9HYPO|nr:kinesin [Trichoderma guizhouense]